MPARKKGRVPVAPPEITYNEYEWIPGLPETMLRDRIGSKKNAAGEKCPYSVKTTKGMLKKGITPDAAALQQLNKLFMKMGVKHVSIFWDVFTAEDAVMEDVARPHVKITYLWQGRSWFMAQDKFKAPLANLRACIEAIDGLYKLSRSRCIHDFSKLMNRFESNLVRIETDQKRPSKANRGWNARDNYKEILELKDEDLTIQADIPNEGRFFFPTRDVLKRQYRNMCYYYHPERPETCPDEFLDSAGNVYLQPRTDLDLTKEALSFQLIQAAGEFVEKRLRVNEDIQLPSEPDREPTMDAYGSDVETMSEANKLAREKARAAMEAMTSTMSYDREPTALEMEVLAEDEAEYQQPVPDEDYNQL